MARLLFLSLLFLPVAKSQDGPPSSVGCSEPLIPLISSIPAGLNQSGVVLSEHVPASDWQDCAASCCRNATCGAVLFFGRNDSSASGGTVPHCWHISCRSDDLCQPIKQTSDSRGIGTMVVVRTTTRGSSPGRSLEPVTAASLAATATVCEVGLEPEFCAPHEVCRPLNSKSRNGVCVSGTTSSTAAEPATPPTTSTTSTSPPTLLIAVSVANKTIRLPTNTANLTAFTVPQSSPDDRFKFEWRLKSSNSLGTEMDSNSDTLKLSGLAEGVYIFKVVVTATNPPGYGEAMANVTVLPAQRLNTPPRAVIVPATQTVTLPTSTAILDGTQSSDDSGSVAAYAWEIHSGPLGYTPALQPVSTLTLENLVAGNYTIKLTVKDEEGEMDSALANLTVLEETDYPPKANAGEDKIVFLPQKTVVLNGNQSSDDHAIVSWEWTKKKMEDGVDLPADITGARSPFLTVANLEQGIYTFILKVTDAVGNAKTDEVTVYVKPPSDYPPTAEAGADQAHALPLAYVTLDGSGSRDDLNITTVRWEMVEGPKKPVLIAEPTALVTNVTGLTVGAFLFRLWVGDTHGNNASDTVRVTVKQDSNQAPVARIVGPASGDIVLPVNSVLLDGTASSDDLAVEKWEWSRDGHSLAAGSIIGNVSGPHLLLTDPLPGSYIFQLQVWDEQGKTDTSRISLSVVEDPARKSTVDLLLDRELARFTHTELKNFLDTVKIFVRTDSEVQVEVEKLTAARRTGFALLRFKVQKIDPSSPKAKYLSGVEVVSKLKEALATNPNILGIPVLELETVVCQNTCGGHGVCDQSTRECVCQPFWTENIFTRYFLSREPNCDWSVIYVCVVVGSLCLGLVLACCCFKCRRRKVGGTRGQKYSRLQSADMELTGGENGQVGTTTATSDSEEEEILFESSKKARRLNGTGLRASKDEPSVRQGGLLNGGSSQLNA